MNSAEPIKKLKDLENLKKYYKEVQPNPRNALLITLGLNTALRISDILRLKWESVYDFERKEYKSHICIVEQKTGKNTQIYINRNVADALQAYKMSLKSKKSNSTVRLFILS